MKTLFVFLAIILFSSLAAFAQQRQDVVYLKNGDIYKGLIIKDVPGEYLQIEMRDGSVKRISYSDIEKRESESSGISQTDGKKRNISFGAKAGITYTNILYDNSIDDFKTGLGLGGFLKIPIGKKNSIQPELLFVQHGSQYTYSNGDEGSLTADLLAIPVIYNLTVELSDASNINFYPGLGIAYNLSTTAKRIINGQEMKQDVTDTMESFILFTGLGVSFDTIIHNNMSLIFDIRLNSSRTNLAKTTSSKSNDISFYFTVGLGF